MTTKGARVIKKKGAGVINKEEGVTTQGARAKQKMQEL